MAETIFGKPRVCPHRMAFTLDNWLRRIIQNPRRIVGTYLEPGGHLLIVEPRFHVTQPAFVRLEALVESVGYAVQDRPRGKGGRSLLLTHGQN